MFLTVALMSSEKSYSEGINTPFVTEVNLLVMT